MTRVCLRGRRATSGRSGGVVRLAPVIPAGTSATTFCTCLPVCCTFSGCWLNLPSIIPNSSDVAFCCTHAFNAFLRFISLSAVAACYSPGVDILSYVWINADGGERRHRTASMGLFLSCGMASPCRAFAPHLALWRRATRRTLCVVKNWSAPFRQSLGI